MKDWSGFNFLCAVGDLLVVVGFVWGLVAGEFVFDAAVEEGRGGGGVPGPNWALMEPVRGPLEYAGPEGKGAATGPPETALIGYEDAEGRDGA